METCSWVEFLHSFEILTKISGSPVWADTVGNAKSSHASSTKTFARGAHLIFLDESGFFLNPSVRRTWSPSGQTPILDAWDRRDRLSAISTLSISSVNHRLGLQFRLLTHNVRADDVVAYLRELKHCPGVRVELFLAFSCSVVA